MSGYALFAFFLWLTNAMLSPSMNAAMDRMAIQEAATTATLAALKIEQPAEPTSLRKLGADRGLMIGAAVEALPLVREADFARLLVSQFSLLSTENRLKFSIVHPQRDRYDFEQGDVIIRFAEANHLAVRGHTLVWHDMLANWVTASNLSTTEAGAVLHDHIRTVMQRYAGRIPYWDVVNEVVADDGSMRNTPWRRMLGEGYIAQAFRWAREADPHARLFLNDFGIETICPKSDTFYRLVQRLQAEHVPLDGIGFQMHLSLAGGLSTQSLQQNLKRFAGLGLDIHITEIDVSLDQTGVTSATLQRQAEMYRDVLETVLQFPQVKAIVFWGAADRHSWKTVNKKVPDAPLLFDADLHPKPARDAVAEVLRRK